MATIDGGGTQSAQQDFEKYFKGGDLFELFEFNAQTCQTHSDTLEMLLAKDGFPYEKTPTNENHIQFLNNLDQLVKGITLNTNLYTNKTRSGAG